MHSLPLSGRRTITGAIVVAGALLVGGRYLADTGAPAAPQPLEPLAVETAARPRVLVHVVGAVRRPGLYRLADGSRIADAVERAGGPTRKADLAAINLAAPVSDGSQVIVPARAHDAARAAPGSTPAPGPVSLNSATPEELDELPGIGPVTAQKIVEYREQNGPFASVDDLDAVSGIGPARLEELRPLVVP